MIPGDFQRMNVLGSTNTPFLFILDFDLRIPVVLHPAEAAMAGIFYQIHAQTNMFPGGLPGTSSFDFQKFPIPFVRYKEAFDVVMRHIGAGNSYLVNLTFPTPVITSLSLHDIFIRSVARYKLLVNNTFVVFSPEKFIQIRDNRIYAYPMKGTVDAALPDARKQLLNDQKELAEHYTIVDLIRNDLSIVSKNVGVERFRYLETVQTNFKNLIQASSCISGDLPSDYAGCIGDILFQLLPAGSISGAPKQKTIDIIHEAESDNRGYFTGVFGLFDGHDLDAGVMIRFIEQTPTGLLYKSGGGITSFSDAASEYQEMIDKVYVPFV